MRGGQLINVPHEKSGKKVVGMKTIKIMVLLTVSFCLIFGSPGFATVATDKSKDQKLNGKPSEISAVSDKHKESNNPARRPEVPRSEAGSSGWAKWVSIAKDVLLGIAAIIGAVVACLGLGTWKRQLRGQTEYELAKRILRLCYCYRDAIRGVRKPLIMPYELVLPHGVNPESMKKEEREILEWSNALKVRCDRVKAVREELYPELLEAEALWNGRVNDLTKRLFDLEVDLVMAVEEEIQSRNPKPLSSEHRSLDDPQSKRKRKAMLCGRLSEEDDFHVMFENRLKAVSEVLKEHLKK